MKSTSKPALYKRRLKTNGKYPVKIKVTFQREKGFFDLGIDMTEKEFSEYHLNKKLQGLFEDITFYKKKADTLIDKLKDDFTFPIFRQEFYKQAVSFKAIDDDFFKYCSSQKEKLEKEGRIQYAASDGAASNKVKEFYPKEKLPFSEIKTDFLTGWEKFMKSKELSRSTIGIYMRNFRALFNLAINDKIIGQEFYPFGKNKYSPPKSSKSKKALSIDDIGKIYSYAPISKMEDWARDMWMFAYFGNGLNVKDIALLKFKNIKDGEITFIRSKTENSKTDDKVIRIVIQDELKTIIDKWGKKPSQSNSYIFNIIKVDNPNAKQIYRDVNQSIKNINKYVKQIATTIGLERVPTTNFARHSYATVLKRAGIPIEMISEQLGHTTVKTTEIYLDSFEKEQRLELSKHLTAFKTKAS